MKRKKMFTKIMILSLGLLMMVVSTSVSQAASEKITIETTTLAISQIPNVYHKTFQIVDYTMTNIQNFFRIISLGCVPVSNL